LANKYFSKLDRQTVKDITGQLWLFSGWVFSTKDQCKDNDCLPPGAKKSNMSKSVIIHTDLCTS
jgi:hypothetical protein